MRRTSCLGLKLPLKVTKIWKPTTNITYLLQYGGGPREKEEYRGRTSRFMKGFFFRWPVLPWTYSRFVFYERPTDRPYLDAYMAFSHEGYTDRPTLFVFVYVGFYLAIVYFWFCSLFLRYILSVTVVSIQCVLFSKLENQTVNLSLELLLWEIDFWIWVLTFIWPLSANVVVKTYRNYLLHTYFCCHSETRENTSVLNLHDIFVCCRCITFIYSSIICEMLIIIK